MPLGLALTAPGLRLLRSATIVEIGPIVSPPPPPPPPPPLGVFLANELGDLVTTDMGDNILLEALA